MWIEADEVTAIAAGYRRQSTSLGEAAGRLRAERFGCWGIDPEVASFGVSFAALAAVAARELDGYASSTRGLGDTLSTASASLIEADLSWRR